MCDVKITGGHQVCMSAIGEVLKVSGVLAWSRKV